MEGLLHLQDKILRTSQALGRLEAEVALRPNSRSLQSNVLSLKKLHRNLQHDFSIAADNLGLDVCHYRMLEDRPPAKALGGAIGTFQDALSLTYECLRTGIPKAKRIFNASTVEQTELRVAYSYPGSFGVAFTIPNERLLFPDMRTTLDKAVETIFDLGKAADNKAIISRAAQQIGRAPIVAIHDWAKVNVNYGVGAYIRWAKTENTGSEVLIQEPEFGLLYESLERIVETRDEEIVVQGILVGADAKSRRFHFVIDGTFEEIRGRFTDAISDTEQASIPSRYTARLHKTTEISYAMDEEKISYLLLRLEKLGDANT
jgi:hypothetical protein